MGYGLSMQSQQEGELAALIAQGGDCQNKMLVNKLSLNRNFVMFAFIWVFTSKTSFILSSKQKAT